jgi:hypothetical protein
MTLLLVCLLFCAFFEFVVFIFVELFVEEGGAVIESTLGSELATNDDVVVMANGRSVNLTVAASREDFGCCGKTADINNSEELETIDSGGKFILSISVVCAIFISVPPTEGYNSDIDLKYCLQESSTSGITSSAVIGSK